MRGGMSCIVRETRRRFGIENYENWLRLRKKRFCLPGSMNMMCRVFIQKPSDHALIRRIMNSSFSLEIFNACTAELESDLDCIFAEGQFIRGRQEISYDLHIVHRVGSVFDFVLHIYFYHIIICQQGKKEKQSLVIRT